MKKVFLIFAIVTLCAFMTNAQEVVGKISNGNYVLTMNTNEIKSAGEALLAQQGITTKLTSFEILQDRVDGTGDIYYFLLAKNDYNSVKLATTLSLKNNSFYPEGNYLLSNSATCTGCTKGCSPRRHADDGIIEWYCSDCTKGTGCKKTESSGFGLTR